MSGNIFVPAGTYAVLFGVVTHKFEMGRDY